jgi:NAD(P)H-dependent flavin oxidoreductase YrpB (nitropropane dioxygenase family)
VVDIPTLAGLGLPLWLAGSYASPERLREAKSLGAEGVQIGTLFAYSDDSGFDPALVAQVRDRVLTGDLRVRADWRASPTGFPFRVAELPDTLTDPEVIAARQPVCDLGVLRTAYLKSDGAVDYRCPAEPRRAYLRKGGREANTEGRVCLCNALLASAGMGQRRRNGAVEPPLVTSGEDLSGVRALLRPDGEGRPGYSAQDVVDYLLGRPGNPSAYSRS